MRSLSLVGLCILSSIGCGIVHDQITARLCMAADNRHEWANLERSFWLHASLSAKAQKGYWGPAFPLSPTPSMQDVRNAATLLTDKYAANWLYLVYHQEIPLADAEQVFRWWRQHCPETVRLVPTVVLRMYDQQQTPVFTSDELRQLVQILQRTVNSTEIAVYDVYGNRDQCESAHMAKLTAWHRHYTRFRKVSVQFCDWRWPDFVNLAVLDKVGCTGIAEPRFFNTVTGGEMSYLQGIELGRKIWNLDQVIWTLQGWHADATEQPQWSIFWIPEGAAD